MQSIPQEKCSVTLTDFQTNITETFKQFGKTDTFSDVTLACDDGQLFNAHKIVLSAGSKFFRNILERTKHPQPFIYLKGINVDELGNIIDFLSTGEAIMEQENLETFMKVAEELQINGLNS
jgi:hypothetical protein